MNYQKYAIKAFDKLKEKGGVIKIKRSNKKYDKKTNTYTGTDEEFGGYAVRLNFNLKNIDGTNIKFGDSLFMASLEKRPQQNDTVEFKGKTYTIQNVEPCNPNGETDIFYNIQAR